MSDTYLRPRPPASFRWAAEIRSQGEKRTNDITRKAERERERERDYIDDRDEREREGGRENPRPEPRQHDAKREKE